MYHIISLSIRQFHEVWKISGLKSIRQLLGKRPSKEIKTTALVLLFWVRECWYLYLGRVGAGTYIGECGCWYLRQEREGAGTYVRSARVLVGWPQHDDVLAVTVNLLPVRRVQHRPLKHRRMDETNE